MARSALHNLEKEPFIKLEPLVIIGSPFGHIRYLPTICHSATFSPLFAGARCGAQRVRILNAACNYLALYLVNFSFAVVSLLDAIWRVFCRGEG